MLSLKGFKKVILDSFFIFLFSALTGIIFNIFHKNRIPFVAKYEYEIYTDCPEFLAKVSYIKISKALTLVGKEGVIFVDTRSSDEYKQSHIKGAVNIEYDVLYGVSEDSLKNLKGASFIITYDDVPSDAKFKPASALASELKHAGFKNVKYLYEPFSEWEKKGVYIEGKGK